VQHALAVAVQVQHDVGVDAQAQQRAAQAFERRARGQRLGELAQRLAHEGDVGVRIGPQPAIDAREHALVQVGVVAVEVLAAAQVEAAHRRLQHALREADRVGHGHQHDLADDAAFGLQRRQALAQVMGDQQAGDLVGVQRGLQRGLGAGAGRAEMQAQQLRGDAGRAVGQGVVDGLHRWLLCQGISQLRSAMWNSPIRADVSAK